MPILFKTQCKVIARKIKRLDKEINELYRVVIEQEKQKQKEIYFKNLEKIK